MLLPRQGVRHGFSSHRHRPTSIVPTMWPRRQLASVVRRRLGFRAVTYRRRTGVGIAPDDSRLVDDLDVADVGEPGIGESALPEVRRGRLFVTEPQAEPGDVLGDPPHAA